MTKATAPAPDGSRIAPSSQAIRLRNTPANSRGDPTSESEKQHNVQQKVSNAIARGEFEEARRHASALASLTPDSPEVSEMESRIDRAQQMVSAAIERGEFEEAGRLVQQELAGVTPESPRVSELDRRIGQVQAKARRAE